MPNPFPHPLILGHRGAPLEAVENTLRSLQTALDRGADGVEIDVQRSRDGTPLVIHDPTLDRTMGVTGRVAALDWPAVQRVTGARVPSVEQVVAWAAAADAWLNVEIKAPGVEQEVVRLLRQAAREERCVISSFHSSIVRTLVESAPDLRTYLLTEQWDELARRAVEETGASGVCLRVDSATDAVLGDLHRRGLPVIVWTVNAPLRVRELLSSGAAGIISDDPGMARAQRDRLGAR